MPLSIGFIGFQLLIFHCRRPIRTCRRFLPARRPLSPAFFFAAIFTRQLFTRLHLPQIFHADADVFTLFRHATFSFPSSIIIDVI
jgi:hypothetical protein